MNLSPEQYQKIRSAPNIALLLDYDGTLSEFAPTPDDVIPNPEIIDLIRQLKAHPKIQPGIISGRRLAHIEKLIPLSGIWLAGSYGIELRSPARDLITRIVFEKIRPYLDGLKPEWANLISGEKGFYLEDKGWSLAIHAKNAKEQVAEQILSAARSIVKQRNIDRDFNLLGGYRFLEIAPVEANKANTVTYLLERFHVKTALPIYLGDDDKDEQAFPVVWEQDGLVGYVGNQSEAPGADFRLERPAETRRWLHQLLKVV